MYVVSATLMGMMLTFSAALAVLNLQNVPAALLPEAKLVVGEIMQVPLAGEIVLTGASVNHGASKHLFDGINDQRCAVFRKGSGGEWIIKPKLLDRCGHQQNATLQRVYSDLSMRRAGICALKEVRYLTKDEQKPAYAVESTTDFALAAR